MVLLLMTKNYYNLSQNISETNHYPNSILNDVEKTRNHAMVELGGRRIMIFYFLKFTFLILQGFD